MSAHADILESLLAEFSHFERRVSALTRDHERRIVAARAHLNDSASQLVSRAADHDRPPRQDGTFLPVPPPSSASDREIAAIADILMPGSETTDAVRGVPGSSRYGRG